MKAKPTRSRTIGVRVTPEEYSKFQRYGCKIERPVGWIMRELMLKQIKPPTIDVEANLMVKNEKEWVVHKFTDVQ